MNCLYNLAKIIKCRQRQQKITGHIGFALGATIGGSVIILLAKTCCKETENVKNIDEDATIIRDEIKQTLEKVDDESIGVVGVALEKALEDL